MLQAVYKHGLPVAEPLWLEPSGAVIGQPFMVSGHRPGDADRRLLLANPARAEILEHLAAALAGLHMLPIPEPHVAEMPSERVATLRGWAGDLADIPGGLIAGLNWLDRNAPDPQTPGIVHRDFRTGNFLIAGDTLSAILDWEFAGAGDVHEDIGWFCACCWRGENTQREAGGLGSRDAFYQAYMTAGGPAPDPARVHFWEVFAHTRWALIAMQQGARRGGRIPALGTGRGCRTRAEPGPRYRGDDRVERLSCSCRHGWTCSSHPRLRLTWHANVDTRNKCGHDGI